MPDLFGNPTIPDGPAMTPQQRRKALGIKRAQQAKGYYAAPGTGPDGESCRTCKHATPVHAHRTWWKCALAKPRWSHSVGTDIRLKSPACVGWKAAA